MESAQTVIRYPDSNDNYDKDSHINTDHNSFSYDYFDTNGNSTPTSSATPTPVPVSLSQKFLSLVWVAYAPTHHNPDPAANMTASEAVIQGGSTNFA